MNEIIKTVMITGGTRGIGLSIVKKILSTGAYNVVFTYNKNKKIAEKILSKQQSKINKFIACHLEQDNKESIKHAVDYAKSELDSSIDILINNAAMSQEKNFFDINANDWEKMLNVNLKGPFMLSQEILPGMIEQRWGRIINISSVGGQWGGYRQVHYAASKAGLINFTKSLSNLFSDQGVTSNCISIGLVETDMSKNEINSSEGKEKIKNIPIGRIGNTNEIVDTVLFLCSNGSSYITGQTINLNGGMYTG
tara:strand:- start:2197 stop:2952 length:756 start_codon:yes stop_codon:yes gene_type:complete